MLLKLCMYDNIIKTQIIQNIQFDLKCFFLKINCFFYIFFVLRQIYSKLSQNDLHSYGQLLSFFFHLENIRFIRIHLKSLNNLTQFDPLHPKVTL